MNLIKENNYVNKTLKNLIEDKATCQSYRFFYTNVEWTNIYAVLLCFDMKAKYSNTYARFERVQLNAYWTMETSLFLTFAFNS